MSIGMGRYGAYCTWFIFFIIYSGEGVILVNDTVIGDPLLTVPLRITNADGLALNPTLSLCYEVHGRSNEYFNLISDQCVSVNAHYVAAGPFNVINRIAVRAVDERDRCQDILVDADNACSAEIDGIPVDVFSAAGVSVRRFAERVRISVPNCDKQQLVMWVICENGSLQSYNPESDGMVFQARMIKFVVARGFNLQETSHGIIGTRLAGQSRPCPPLLHAVSPFLLHPFSLCREVSSSRRSFL